MKNRLFVVLMCLSLGILAQEKKELPARPKLIVGIVVEHMRYDYLTRFWDQYDHDGFRRMVREGALCKNTVFENAYNQDAVGYASISTGTYPSRHGIVGNSWYDRFAQRMRYSVEDVHSKTLGAANDNGNFAPTLLLAPTFADALKLNTMGRAKVFAVAMKESGAIFMGGNAADGAFWFDPKSGKWISSSFYGSELPYWVTRFNDRNESQLALDKKWELELPADQYYMSLPDANEFEVGLMGYKKAFPYFFADLKGRTNDFSLLRYSPYGNTYTRDFALSAVINEKLGKDHDTDLLMVGFSATGFLGEYYPPNSMEMQDAYLKLDKDIGYMLRFLDQQIGKDNYLVFLTGNTGEPQSQAWLRKMKQPTGLFNQNTAIPLLRSYIKALYGQKAEWVKGYNELQVYLDRDAIWAAGKSLEEVQLRVADFLSTFEGVAYTATATDLQRGNMNRSAMLELENSYHPKRGADVYLVLQPGWGQTNETTGQNSPFSDQTQVPLIWFGWKIRPSVVESQVSPIDIVPTIASMLNMAKPSATTGGVIHGISVE